MCGNEGSWKSVVGMEWGLKPTFLLGSSGPQVCPRLPGETHQVLQTATQEDCCCHWVEMFTATSRPGLGQKSGLGEGSGALQDTAPSQLHRLPSSPADSRPGELESSLGEGWDLPLNLTHCLMTTILLTVDWMGPLMSFTKQLVACGRGPLWYWPMAEQNHQWSLFGKPSLGGRAHCGADQWLSRTINGHSLANPHLGEGPTVVLTNGWAGPLTVTLRQLLTWGRGPPWCWQWLSRTTKGPHH